MKTKFTILIIFLYLTLFGESVSTPPSNYAANDSGTMENPYLISDLSNLRWLSETQEVWGSKSQKFFFLQTAPIDATETRNWNDGKGFSPIGALGEVLQTEDDSFNFSLAFYGCYNGQSYPIENLFIASNGNVGELPMKGLFGTVLDAKLINIKLENILFIVEESNIGALCVSLFNSSVSNCSVSGIIILNHPTNMTRNRGRSIASGLIHQSWNSSIDQCFAIVDMISNGDNNKQFNGLVYSLSNSTLSNSYFRGTMLNPGPNSSGLVGTAEGTIINCFTAVNTNSIVYGISYFPLDSTIKNTYYLTSHMIKKAHGIRFIDRMVIKSLPKDKREGGQILSFTGGGIPPQKKITKSQFKGWDFIKIWNIDPTKNGGFPYLRGIPKES